jgi:hypothetical protein
VRDEPAEDDLLNPTDCDHSRHHMRRMSANNEDTRTIVVEFLPELGKNQQENCFW